MLQHLREVHPNLNISALEEEFGGPTGGRPDTAAVEEATSTSEEAGMEEEAIVSVDYGFFLYFVMASVPTCNCFEY